MNLSRPKTLTFFIRNWHMKCYYFCKQCKDYFEIAKAKRHKCVSFVTTFRKDRIFITGKSIKFGPNLTKLLFFIKKNSRHFCRKTKRSPIYLLAMSRVKEKEIAGINQKKLRLRHPLQAFSNNFSRVRR